MKDISIFVSTENCTTLESNTFIILRSCFANARDTSTNNETVTTTGSNYRHL